MPVYTTSINNERCGFMLNISLGLNCSQKQANICFLTGRERALIVHVLLGAIFPASVATELDLIFRAKVFRKIFHSYLKSETLYC